MKTKENHSQIIDWLNKKKIRFDSKFFPSGAYMIDVWNKDDFYVIQLEEDMIGFSIVNDETDPFSTIPDSQFTDMNSFFAYANSIVK